MIWICPVTIFRDKFNHNNDYVIQSHHYHNTWDLLRKLTRGDSHGYKKTCGFEVMGFAGIGMVVDLGTLQHTVYPYCGILGIQWVYYSTVSIFFIVLKLIFLLYLIIVCYCVTLWHNQNMVMPAMYHFSSLLSLSPLPSHIKTK